MLIYFPYLLRYWSLFTSDACSALPPTHVFYGCPSHWYIRHITLILRIFSVTSINKYTPNENLVAPVGLEPTTKRLKVSCSANWAKEPNIWKLAGGVGIEPTLRDLEFPVLPLHQPPIRDCPPFVGSQNIPTLTGVSYSLGPPLRVLFPG